MYKRQILVLPCADHTKSWQAADVARFQALLRQADKSVCLAEHYYRGCMQARNRRLVDFSGTCVCYLTRRTGGTAYTVAYAQKHGLRILNLAD